MDNMKTAMQIFRELLEKGQMDRETNSELFLQYSEPEVQELMNVIVEEMNCQILRVKNTIYLVPDFDNQLLGYRNKDLREWLGSNARQPDVFLGYYITAFIINLFYGGKNRDPKQREFLSLATVIDELDLRIKRILENGEEYKENEREFSMNFKSIAQNWDSKRSYEEGSRSTTKLGFLLRVMRLLQLEGLVRI